MFEMIRASLTHAFVYGSVLLYLYTHTQLGETVFSLAEENFIREEPHAQQIMNILKYQFAYSNVHFLTRV